MNLNLRQLACLATLCCSFVALPNVVAAKGSWEATGSMAAGCSVGIRALEVTPAKDQAFWIFDAPFIGGEQEALCGSVKSALIMGMNLEDNTFFALGNGLPDTSRAIHVTDTYVYASTYVLADDFSFETTTIRRWDGQSWSVIGMPQRGEVLAITEYQGALHIAISPKFNEGYVKRWDGSNWVLVGQFNNRVLTLAADENALYAGGIFDQLPATGLSANRIAKFEAGQWTALGTGLETMEGTFSFSAEVHGIEVAGTDVYVTGRFEKAGGQAANHIARWNGTTWSALGSGLSHVDGSTVRGKAIYVDGQTVYVGGGFTQAGGQPASQVAKWDGSEWSGLGVRGLGINLSSEVTGLAMVGNELLVGGGFSSADGQVALNLALWNKVDDQWQVFAGAPGQLGLTSVRSLNFFGGKLHAGLNSGLFRLESTGWEEVVDGQGLGIDGTVFQMLFTPTELYLGGRFFTAGGQTVNHVAKWDGVSWSGFGSGASAGVSEGIDPFFGFDNTRVLALALDGNDLYVGGDFSKAGGVDADYVARWDGSAWSGLYSSAKSIEFDGQGSVSDIVIVPNDGLPGSDVYFSGRFKSAGGQVANHIARWDGNEWHALTEEERVGVGDSVSSMHVFDGAIYVATGSTYEGVSGLGGRVERWVMADSAWQSVGEAFSGEANQPFEVFDYGGDLYVAGVLTQYEGAPLRNVARWTGSKWVALGSGQAAGPNAIVFDVFAPPGAGIYMAGDFTEVDGRASSGSAKFWPALFWDRFEE